MGIENFGEKKKTSLFENEFADLGEKEKEMKKRVTAIFQENAELNSLLLSDSDLDMTEKQKQYRTAELSKIRQEVKELFHGTRSVTGTEIPEELKGVKEADNYYKELKKAA